MTTKKTDKQMAVPTNTAASAGESTRVETVTIEMAAELLKRNVCNRKPVMAYVEVLANMIKAGEWQVTHQGLAVGADGSLYDGQHRLMAMIKAGVAVQMRVTRGLPPEARLAIDTGTSRRAHDVLAIVDGVILGTVMRAALTAARMLVRHGSLMTGAPRLTVYDLRAAIEEHGDDARAVIDALGSGHDRLANAAMLGALIIAHRSQPKRVCEFARLLRSGADMSDGHPALALRNYVLVKYASNGGASRDDLALRTFSSVDAFVKGRTQNYVKVSSGARAKYLTPWRKDSADESGNG